MLYDAITILPLGQFERNGYFVHWVSLKSEQIQNHDPGFLREIRKNIAILGCYDYDFEHATKI